MFPLSLHTGLSHLFAFLVLALPDSLVFLSMLFKLRLLNRLVEVPDLLELTLFLFQLGKFDLLLELLLILQVERFLFDDLLDPDVTIFKVLSPLLLLVLDPFDSFLMIPMLFFNFFPFLLLHAFFALLFFLLNPLLHESFMKPLSKLALSFLFIKPFDEGFCLTLMLLRVLTELFLLTFGGGRVFDSENQGVFCYTRDGLLHRLKCYNGIRDRWDITWCRDVVSYGKPQPLLQHQFILLIFQGSFNEEPNLLK